MWLKKPPLDKGGFFVFRKAKTAAHVMRVNFANCCLYPLRPLKGGVGSLAEFLI